MNTAELLAGIERRDTRAIARAISLVEDSSAGADAILAGLDRRQVDRCLFFGITGPPGSGKSTLTDKLIGCFRQKGHRVGVIAIDPSSALSGGAVLGDRVRMMDHAADHDVVIRSMASRGRLGGLCAAAGAVARVMAASGCSPVLIETVGVGQLEMDIIRLADVTALVLAPGQGDEIQAMKAGVLEVVDLLVVNKSDLSGAEALAMDLETILRQGGGPNQIHPICKTIATSGEGVAALAVGMENLYETFHQSGRLQARRMEARRLEAADWALDFLRQRMLRRLGQEITGENDDPRLIARRIVEEMERGGK
ncbi:MAG: methylmalonyl Co-A mutase-associated GTPase MeaB [Deltaproteobacteria bacterium]